MEGAGPGGTQGGVLKKREWLWSEGHSHANGQGQDRPGATAGTVEGAAVLEQRERGPQRKQLS